MQVKHMTSGPRSLRTFSLQAPQCKAEKMCSPFTGKLKVLLQVIVVNGRKVSRDIEQKPEAR